MIPEKIPAIRSAGQGVPQDLGYGDLWCSLAGRWLIAADLAYRLGLLVGFLEEDLGFELAVTIISGWRSAEVQAGLPHAAPDALSTHRSCPATGADLWLSTTADNALKLKFGLAAQRAGLRWGGGSPIDPNTQIPSDWNHVDLGRRST